MKWMLNMTDCSGDVERFRDGADAAAYLRHLGFDGFELMHLPGGDPSFFPEGSVGGIHLNYWYDWLDLWLGEEQALKEEYGSLQAAEEIYGALDRSSICGSLEEGLELAHARKVPYVVFHVSNVKNSEIFTYRFSRTDEEVVDAAARLVNHLLDGKPYEFEFLMENLWWPGLTLTRPEITRRLLEQIHYPGKGIMLDTGHLMHTNLELRTQEEAIDYVLEQVQRQEELAGYIRGIHLNQSLTGEFVKEYLSHPRTLPEDYRKREEISYPLIFQTDRHLPFTSSRTGELLKTIRPRYLTFEFITCDRQEQEEKVLLQRKALEEGGIFRGGNI